MTRSLSLKTPRSRTVLTGVDWVNIVPATDNGQWGSCDNQHRHIIFVLSALSWSRFEHIHLEMLTTHSVLPDDRVEVAADPTGS